MADALVASRRSTQATKRRAASGDVSIVRRRERVSRRILPFHEAAVWGRFPSASFGDGLHVAEVSLAGGHPSVVS